MKGLINRREILKPSLFENDNDHLCKTISKQLKLRGVTKIFRYKIPFSHVSSKHKYNLKNTIALK